MSTFLSRLLLAVLLTFAATHSFAQAPGKDAKPKAKAPLEILLTGDETQDQLDKLMASAGKDGRPVVVRVQPNAKAGADDDKDEISGLFALVEAGINRGIAGMVQLAKFPTTFNANYEQVMGPLDGQRLWLVPLPILFGLIAGFLVYRALRRMKPDRSTDDDVSMTARCRNGLQRLLINAAAFAMYRVVSFITGKALLGLSGPYIATMIAINTRVTQVLIYLIFAHVLLYPYANGQRIVPLRNGARHFRLTLAYACFGPLMHYVSGLIETFGGTREQNIGWLMILSSAATLFKLWWFWTARRDLAFLVMFGAPEGTRITALRRFLANSVAPIFILSAILVWLVARAATATPAGTNWGVATTITQFYVILVPLLVTGAAGLAREWFAANPSRYGGPFNNAVRETSVFGLAAIVWMIATLDLGRVWSEFLSANLGEMGLNMIRSLMTAAVTGVVGMLAWNFLRTLFDGYLPKQRSGMPGMDEENDDGEPNIQSRLASILPVLRGVALVIIAALTLLFILTKLGVETAPLLAGFGILGLALSFGSQSLIKDVVAGIFFLADDAFRVGEYIDTGRLKGTVERITLRAVQLRHQSGLVHTIPYGQLQAVTNASRDWATVKFTIRLDHKADIEKSRKVIKKIGQELLSHEELGEDFFLPVKMQGIHEIQDNAIVVRIKFTAKPFRTSQIQREALKRIYIGLTEAGIPLATNAVSVRSGTPEAAAAAFANANATLPLPTSGS